MSFRAITAALAALTLGAGVAGGCGDGNSNREQPQKGNPGQQVPQGSSSTTETNPTTLQSTAPEQPEVTQPETGP